MLKSKMFLFIIGLSILLFFQSGLLPEKRVLLRGLGRPIGLTIDNSQLYIQENHRIHIYSLKNYKKKNSFGKRGQGPGEFQTLPHVHITLDCSTDKLIIGSIRKVSYFSKEGIFLNEVKGKNQALRLVYLDKIKGKSRFLGWSQKAYNKFNYNSIVVFDHELNKIKQIYKEKDPFQGAGKGYDLLTKVFSFIPSGQKILIPGKDKDSIDILDFKMNFLFTIRVDTKPIIVSDVFKKNMIHFLKTSPETKNVFQMISPVRFPKYFPSVNQFFADNGIIYVMTWEKTKDGDVFFMYDMNGKFLGKKSIPIRYETDIQTYPIAVRNNKLYQLIENDKEDEWELVINDL